MLDAMPPPHNETNDAAEGQTPVKSLTSNREAPSPSAHGSSSSEQARGIKQVLRFYSHEKTYLLLSSAIQRGYQENNGDACIIQISVVH